MFSLQGIQPHQRVEEEIVMTRRRRSTDQEGALSLLMLQVLLVLTEGDRHGYAMLQEIESRTGKTFDTGVATLYRTLKRLVDADLIREVSPEPGGHSQRRSYGLTESGRARAQVEARRLESIVRWAQSTEVLGSES